MFSYRGVEIITSSKICIKSEDIGNVAMSNLAEVKLAIYWNLPIV